MGGLLSLERLNNVFAGFAVCPVPVGGGATALVAFAPELRHAREPVLVRCDCLDGHPLVAHAWNPFRQTMKKPDRWGRAIEVYFCNVHDDSTQSRPPYKMWCV